ncbi:MAG: hypothetical protein WC650_05015 [Candidatus Doudnabacteria bacterium]
MPCKLCLQDKPLLKKSHIFPNFMYRGLFDDKHILYKINLQNLSQSQRLSSSEYESDILCEECDNKIIGCYENYASKFIYGGHKDIYFENRENKHGIKMTYCKGVDYAKFKLFLLSFLWRASISQRIFFKYVDLGQYQELIRQMLINNNPKDPMDFPCLISTYKSIRDLPSEIVGQPIKYRSNNILGYTFLIGGFIYIFFVSNKNKPAWLSEIIISKNNEMSIVHLDRNNAKNIINHFFQIEMVK